jgi:DNA polymerase sigma
MTSAKDNTTAPASNAFVAPTLFAPSKATVTSFQGLAVHPLDPLLIGAAEATSAGEEKRRVQFNALIARARSRSIDQSNITSTAATNAATTTPTNKKRTLANDTTLAVALTTMPPVSSTNHVVKRSRPEKSDINTNSNANANSSKDNKEKDSAATFVALSTSQESSPLPSWLSKTNASSASSSSSSLTLHDEILALVDLLEPLADEDARRRDSIARLRHIVATQFGACNVCVFGSLRAGCALPESDVDVTLLGAQFPTGSIRGRPGAMAPLRRLDQLLRASNQSFRGALRGARGPGVMGVLALPNARVPIIKWSDWQTGVDMDISFNVGEGAHTSQWVRQRIDSWPCFRPLLLVLKLLLKQRGLADPANGGVGSFTLAVMLASFLNSRAKQYRTVQDRRANVSFDLAAPLATADLGRMLREFFHFFGLCFNTMRCLVLETGIGVRVSTEHMLHVVNPIDPTLNVASASFRFDAVQEVFRHCYLMLESEAPDVRATFATPLARIVFATDALDERRKMIDKGGKRSGQRVLVDDPLPPKSASSKDDKRRGHAANATDAADEFVVHDDSSDEVIVL